MLSLLKQSHLEPAQWPFLGCQAPSPQMSSNSLKWLSQLINGTHTWVALAFHMPRDKVNGLENCDSCWLRLVSQNGVPEVCAFYCETQGRPLCVVLESDSAGFWKKGDHRQRNQIVLLVIWAKSKSLSMGFFIGLCWINNESVLMAHRTFWN